MSVDITKRYAEYIEQLPVHHDIEPRVIAGTKPGAEPPAPREKIPTRFGGMDLAKRIDHSALEILKLEKGVLKEDAYKEWGHTNYSTVAQATLLIHEKLPMEIIGFDRSGVGDAASELFDKSALPLFPIVTTMHTKIDIIHVMRSLFYKGMLKVDRFGDLPTQIEEQEEIHDPKTGNTKYHHPPRQHDDRFWALGYACYVAVPYIINAAPAVIKQGGDGMLQFQERDVDAEIEAIMNNTSINRFG